MRAALARRGTRRLGAADRRQRFGSARDVAGGPFRSTAQPPHAKCRAAALGRSSAGRVQLAPAREALAVGAFAGTFPLQLRAQAPAPSSAGLAGARAREAERRRARAA